MIISILISNISLIITLMLIVSIVLFIVGFVALIKGGDWFVDGTTGIAQRLRVPELLIGATVVSIGTTLPEVMVSAQAAAGGHGEIAYGNAIGSIICNTALIAAITIAVAPSKVDKKTFRVPVIFFFAAAIFYMFISYRVGYFSRITGFILLGGFILYMILTVSQAVAQSKKAKMLPEHIEETVIEEAEGEKGEEKKSSVVKEIALLVIGAAVIAIGARLLVDNGIVIAEALGVPESVIALTFVALGTSLPELVTAITALIKGHDELSLGNVIGANLFNLVLVGGVSTAISPFELPASKTIEIFGKTMNASLVIDLPLMLGVMLLLTLPALIRGKLSRAQGIIMLLLYCGFCAFQFGF